MNFPEIVGSLGVTILLVAFFLNMLKVIKTDSLFYSLLNFVGAGLACYSSWLIRFYPFVVLEGTWSIISLVALVKRSVRNY